MENSSTHNNFGEPPRLALQPRSRRFAIGNLVARSHQLCLCLEPVEFAPVVCRAWVAVHEFPHLQHRANSYSSVMALA
eukprot:107989-Pleurochrysis_carterae.AAC.1